MRWKDGKDERTISFPFKAHSAPNSPTHTEGLSPNLPASLGDLVPDAFPHLPRAIAELTAEGDNLGDDELGDRARVGEGRVEDGDSCFGGGEEVDLVGSDAEAADDEEL